MVRGVLRLYTASQAEGCNLPGGRHAGELQAVNVDIGQEGQRRRLPKVPSVWAGRPHLTR